ncbi:Low-affinity inorganic phosphate transporter 1 [Vibrio vulnificus]|nr:Low-affinity inorganic phosphate transporter 1 [Vibrio vulnificus]
MDILANYGTVLIIVAAVFGFMMAIGIGANDVANAMGTSVGSKALTVKQAIIIAMIFEFAGAYLAGGEVTDTIRKGVIETSLFAHQPDVLVFGMMSALLAAGTWLLLASYMGWPVSTTHSIIGAIIGFACVSVGTEAVDWSSVQGIVGSWIITPLISGFFAYVIFVSAQRLIFDTEKPLMNAKRFVPVYMFITTMVIAQVRNAWRSSMVFLFRWRRKHLQRSYGHHRLCNGIRTRLKRRSKRDRSTVCRCINH